MLYSALISPHNEGTLGARKKFAEARLKSVVVHVMHNTFICLQLLLLAQVGIALSLR